MARAPRLLVGASTALHPHPPPASGFQPTLAWLGLSPLVTPASGAATPPLELPDPPEPPELPLPPEPEPELPEPPPLEPLLDPLLDPELLPLLEPLPEPLLDPELLPLLEPLLELLDPPVVSRRVPLGEPQPVGPSYPTPALQKYEVLQFPLLPEVTSKNFDEFSQGNEGEVLTPRSVKDAATMGEDALVPPTTCHEPSLLLSLQ
jgi:hypothetical protein